MAGEAVKMKDNIVDIDGVMQQSLAAFNQYKKLAPAKRAAFLEAIAAALESNREQLVQIAGEESHLPAGRLNGELTRTTSQLKLFASFIKEGSWVEASIDAPDAGNTAKPDIRKMLVAVGPVIVFGASNFPFAFSTAGGDTASALAAGCTVVIKGHPAHAQTSLLVFDAIEKAIAATGVPANTLQHVAGGFEEGKALVMHPITTGVGFTGSFSGGKALVDYANQREVPIPVFAEMSSVNPVVFYPSTLSEKTAELAATFAGSITLGAGQFCTNPGILIGVKQDGFETFLEALAAEIKKVLPQTMLHKGIHAAFEKGIDNILHQDGLKLLATSATQAGELQAGALLAAVSAVAFLSNHHFAEEIFGPYSLAIVCDSWAEVKQVLLSMKGQLTTTLVANDKDVEDFAEVIEIQHTLAGRIILNNPPTGVEVCNSMVHGGPYPATTDARFTSVGTTAIKRWARPICLQNFTQAMLPDELKNNNATGILRLVNNIYTREAFIQ
jgi:NADP-dependent aldehyde dehydrogenase